MVAGDDQASPRGHPFHHRPKGIGGQLLHGFVAELLESIARLLQLVNPLVWPVMPKDDGWCGPNPVKAVGVLSKHNRKR